MTTRREFLAASSAAAGAVTLAGVAAAATSPIGATTAVAAPAGPFAHGVASGDPLADRVILWTRITPGRPGPVAVRWLIAQDEQCQQVVNQGVVTALPARDWTVRIDADGLEPGRVYWFRFEAENRQSPTGRTRTLPHAGNEHLRFGVVSCSNYQAGYFNAYGHLAERSALDAVLHLGDYIYEYPAGGYGFDPAIGRAHEPAGEILTLADYRARYAQYRTDPDLQAAHAAHPWICIWDDHESANNSWRDGAENHQADEGSWAERRAAAIQAWHEWLPVRERPGAGDSQIWRSFRFGQLADLILLDTRLHGRSEQVADRHDTQALEAPGRTILGEDQAAWLAEELRASVRRGTAWHVIGQQLMFGQLTGDDGAILNTDMWDGYPASRRRILDQLAAEGIADTVILTGDIHSGWAMEITPDPNAPDYDPATGRGARAVEFVTTSITSPSPMASSAPADIKAREATWLRDRRHIRYVNMRDKGYLLLDLTAQRARAEWWVVDTVTERRRGERLDAAFETRRGTQHLRRG